jgi:invasion protein IalB
MSSMKTIARVASLVSLVAAGAVAQTPASLPGGASQLQETHGDWRVACTLQNGQRQCALSQQQADKDSRQLVIAVELKAPSASGDRAEGTIVLPFGLAVDRPVTLQVDDRPGLALRFRTCLPVGCLVAVNFDPAMIAALRTGSLLAVKATAAESAQEAAFRVSLNGFGSALSRTASLSHAPR